VKRCLKRLGFTFRRARRMTAKPACPKKQGRVQRTLSRLHRLENAGRCQVLYGDESGFCLQPPLSYLWQKKGQTVGLPAKAHSRRLNALGFLSRAGCLHHFETQEKITASFVIQSIEALLPALPGPTVLVLDNATVHRSKLVQAKRKEWKQKGLRLLFLPPYCPHLNLIETLWRMIKYRWLWPEAYQNFETLCQSVTDILAQVGTKYRLPFA
jgi:transposase